MSQNLRPPIPPTMAAGQPPRGYAGVLTRPADDFSAVRDGRRAPLLYLDVDLSVARTLANAERIPVAGNAFYVDQLGSSGTATAYFQQPYSQAPTPVSVFAGFALRIPWTEVMITNAAQPGKVLRIIYGVDVDFRPATGAGVSLLNPVNVADLIAPECELIRASLPSGVAPFTASTVLAAASNTRGLRVRYVALLGGAGAGGEIVSYVLASPTPPAAFGSKANTVVLASINAANGGRDRSEVHSINREIPAGWGIFNICLIGVAVATAHVLDMSAEVL